MAKIPPAMWESPGAFVPDEVAESEQPDEVAERPAAPTGTEEPTEGVAPDDPAPDDASFKRIAKEDGEAVEDPEEPRH